jgi:hypothetical protein
MMVMAVMIMVTLIKQNAKSKETNKIPGGKTAAPYFVCNR